MENITLVRTDTDNTAVVLRWPPAVSYVAVSYRWNPHPKSSFKFTTPNYTAKVSAFYHRHFRVLLKWIKEKLNIPYVWIDAICINQEDKRDKAKQIGQITDLFRGAEYVVAAPWLAYLGDADPLAVYAEWARRCWVAAEICAARTLYYTHWNRSMERPMHSRNDPKNEGFCPPGADPGEMSEGEKETHCSISNHVVMLRSNRSFGKFHVDEIAKIAVDLDATIEGDKLVALIPLAGYSVTTIDHQMTLQGIILAFMTLFCPLDRMRLVMGVSRFKGGHRDNMSWSFGHGSDYYSPWATNEYLKNICKASVTLNQDNSLTIHARYHNCLLIRGDESGDSEYYVAGDDSSVGGRVCYHPQMDKPRRKVTLIMCGLDCSKRIVGIVVALKSREKIGIFMWTGEYPEWVYGTNIVK